jgi:hypothetical protein
MYTFEWKMARPKCGDILPICLVFCSHAKSAVMMMMMMMVMVVVLALH